MAWQHISPEVTVKDFEKCCKSNAVDKTDDNVWWNDSEEDGIAIYIHSNEIHNVLALIKCVLILRCQLYMFRTVTVYMFRTVTVQNM